MKEILHFNSTRERLNYLKGKFEEIEPMEVKPIEVKEEPKEEEPKEEPKPKKARKGKKKDGKEAPPPYLPKPNYCYPCRVQKHPLQYTLPAVPR